MRFLLILATLAVGACASDAGRDVAAVVQDEGARQAAAGAASEGAGSREALKAGEDAAARPLEEPPT